jgi:signal transduction histidine kinase
VPTVRVEVTEPLPALPAAVEVAAYRIVQEALTNVVRHAGARHCVARLCAADETLVVEVQDDGRGRARAREGGVGMTSMRERAQEIGGTLRVVDGAAAGTTVRASLPVGSAS